MLIISLVAIISACTHTVTPYASPLPPVKSVAILSLGATRELKARFGISPDDSTIDAGIGSGASVGQLAGMGVALACGPFVVLCATFTVPAGMAAGAVGGGVSAFASDKHKTPPNEQLLKLDAEFVEISQTRVIHQEIRDSLERKIPPKRLADKSVADALIELNLADVRFTRTGTGKYELTLNSSMVMQWDRNKRQVRYGNRAYQCVSPSQPLGDWLQNDGEGLNQAFDACIENLTQQMVDDILFSAQP